MKGNEIRNIRVKLGLTQRELAEILHVDQGTVSRWERDIEAPRPRSLIALRDLLVRDEDRRHLHRSLSVVRNDFLTSVFLDNRLRFAEMSASAERFFRSRGQDPAILKGMTVTRYADRVRLPELLEHVTTSGLLKGEALNFRFTVNAEGQGNTTIWEPVFEDGHLAGVLTYVSRMCSFPENSDFSLELAEFTPADDPTQMVTLHRGQRLDQVRDATTAT